MNGFDRAILEALNTVAHRSVHFDELVAFAGTRNLLAGDILIACFWWAWFLPRPEPARHRACLLATLVGSVAAVVVGRGLALLLPFRLRPIHDPVLSFRIPYGMGPHELHGWSAFPSDHAVLYFCLAFGLLYVSRRMGWTLLVGVALLNGIARIYLLLHYPSDIVGGALVGAALAWAVNRRPVREAIGRPLLGWLEKSPATFYGAAAFTSMQVATMFDDLRVLAHLLLGITTR